MASPKAKAELDVQTKKNALANNFHILALTTLANITTLSKLIHEANSVQGFWPPEGRNDGECIALMHSELSEALEALRHGDPQSEKIPDFTSLEEELADCVIRILDYAGAKDLNLADAITAKLIYNLQRPPKHGKGF